MTLGGLVIAELSGGWRQAELPTPDAFPESLRQGHLISTPRANDQTAGTPSMLAKSSLLYPCHLCLLLLNITDWSRKKGKERAGAQKGKKRKGAITEDGEGKLNSLHHY